jgi:hypothetical protein
MPRCGQALERNPNWLGGRTVTLAGYVLIKRPDHPRADVRGYVYEHFLVMDDKLGRPMAPGERVRHLDGAPGNNDPQNLVIVAPLDRTSVITCACGCGTTMTRLDSAGRVRRYVSGHNTKRGCREGGRPLSETGAGLDPDIKESLMQAFGGECAYGCGNPATAWDHLIPWYVGGTFRSAGNAVPACRACNQSKNGSTDLWKWISKGVASRHSDAWTDLVALAVSWGDLEVEQLDSPEAVTVDA